MHYRSYKDISLAIWKYLPCLPHRYDAIIGVPRSGMIPATILSMYLHTQLGSLDEFCQGMVMEPGKTRRGSVLSMKFDDIRRVLIIDDSICSGESMRRAKNLVDSSIILKQRSIEIEYAAVYSSTGREVDIDFSVEVLPNPRCFQWNIFQNKYRCSTTLYDIDGIVCRDPIPEENDDGPRYIKFLSSVEQKMPICFKVGGFCSSRLEKYRKETEEWLRRHGYSYQNLFLLNLDSKEERIKRQAYATHKAFIYRNTPYTLFVESNWHQAQDIARLAGKDVFCTENMKYINVIH